MTGEVRLPSYEENSLGILIDFQYNWSGSIRWKKRFASSRKSLSFAKERGYDTRAEAFLIEGFPVRFIPAYNDLVRAAVDDAAILKYRGVEAKVVKVEYLIAIALQTGRAKDKERVIRLLDEAVIDRAVLSGILESAGLSAQFEKFESQFYGK